MTATAVRAEPELSPWNVADTRARARRRWLLLAVLAVFVVVSALTGFPTGREVLTGWLLGFLLAACGGDLRVWRRAVVRDWMPLLCVLFLYDLLRGFANEVGASLVSLPLLYNGKSGPDGYDHAHVEPMIRVDTFLFGGHEPTVWLQDHLFDPDHVHWYDVVATATYLSHFVVSLVLAVVLWARAYPVFRRYVWTLVSLFLVTLVTYALFPACPPWMASLNGYLPSGVTQVVGHTISVLGGHVGSSAVEKGSTYANAVAAMPSLHAAIPMMLLLFSWPLVNRWARSGLVVYVLAMATTLVYAGEHYVTDELVGWTFAALCVVGVRVAFRRSGEQAAREEVAST